MRRREFITLVGAAAATWPLGARAQQPDRVRRIAVLAGYGEDDPQGRAYLAAFQQRLNELGWVVGRNVRIDYRWAHGDSDRARMLAKELVELRPDVLLGEATSSVMALKQMTSVVPIVFTNLSDPIGSGLVANLAKPGGNVTGFTNFESSMGGKWLELLKEFAPGVTRVAIMFNPTVSLHIARGYYLDAIKTASERLAVSTTVTPVQNADDIERSLNQFAHSDGGLVVLPDTFTIVHRDVIVVGAAKHRLPAIYSFRLFVTSGGLLYYGINALDQYPRAAMYVDRILRGEKPSDLPVQAPTKFELIINMKVARSLGLTVPPSLLATTDEVIE